MTKINTSAISPALIKKREKLKNNLWIFLFLLPCIIFMLAYSLTPFLIGVVTSFCDWDGLTMPSFCGLENYKTILMEDKTFKTALVNTFKWLLVQLTVQTSLGIIAGFIMSREYFGWKIYRTILMIPHIVPTAALATMFYYIYNPDMGILNAGLEKIGLGFLATNWLAYESTAFWSVTASWIFYCGIVGIMFYSAIISIPQSQKESAMIDGCTRFQTDVYIVLPQLRNTIGTTMVMSATSGMGIFDFIFMLTKGGPGVSTMSLALHVYRTALAGNYGLAMSVAVIQGIIGLVVIKAINKMYQDAY